MLDFSLTFTGQLQITLWDFLRFLDKPMQQDHLAGMDAKQHSGNPLARDITADLVQAAAERPANRHTDRPAEFHCLDILANQAAIFPV
jgi:hypothetical protein